MTENLLQIRIGMSALVASLVKTMDERDPGFARDFKSNLKKSYAQARENRLTDLEALEVINWTGKFIDGLL